MPARAQPKIPGLGRLPKPEPADLELTLEEAKGDSGLENYLLGQIKRAGLPEPLTGYRFHPDRQWKADLAWPTLQPPLLVEIEGGTWSGGRHVRGDGYGKDCVKYNAVALRGFVLLRFTGTMVSSGYAARVIAEYFEVQVRKGRES